jgi:hypothetical protein
MKRRWQQAARVACLALGLGLGSAEARIFDVEIESSGLATLDVQLAFDFNDGGPPTNTVTLGPITSVGGMQLPSFVAAGAVTGSDPGPWVFNDTVSYSSLVIPFAPLGASASFSFTTTDGPAEGLSSPDAFSFFLLDPLTGLPLLTTDPTGALFIVNIGALDGLSVFTLSDYGPQDFAIRVTPAVEAVPEPATVALVAATAMLLMAMRRRRRAKGLRPLR